jgi:hypothetical protein
MTTNNFKNAPDPDLFSRAWRIHTNLFFVQKDAKIQKIQGQNSEILWCEKFFL